MSRTGPRREIRDSGCVQLDEAAGIEAWTTDCLATVEPKGKLEIGVILVSAYFRAERDKVLGVIFANYES